MSFKKKKKNIYLDMPKKDRGRSAGKGKGMKAPPSFHLHRKMSKKKRKDSFAHQSRSESDYSDSETDGSLNQLSSVSENDHNDGSSFATPQGLFIYIFFCLILLCINPFCFFQVRPKVEVLPVLLLVAAATRPMKA